MNRTFTRCPDSFRSAVSHISAAALWFASLIATAAAALRSITSVIGPKAVASRVAAVIIGSASVLRSITSVIGPKAVASRVAAVIIGSASVLLIILSLSVPAAAQQGVWQDEGGPYGGTFISIIAHGDSLVAAPYYRPFLLIGGADGEQWRKIEMPSPAAEAFSLLSPGDGRLLAGSFGRIYRTDDNGAHWQESFIPDLQGAIVTGLAGRGDTLYACGGGMLLRSVNRGAHWQMLENTPEVSAVRMFKDHVVVGGPEGIHSSSDRGKTWESAPLAADTVEALFATSRYLFASLRSPLVTDTLEQLLYRSSDGMQWQGTGRWHGLQYRRSPVAALTEHGDTLFAGLRDAREYQPLWYSADDGASWATYSAGADESVLPRGVWALNSTDDGLLVSLGGIGIWKYQADEGTWQFAGEGHFPVGVAKLGFDHGRIYAYSMKENFIVSREFGSSKWVRIPYFTAGERPGDMYVDTASSNFDSTVVFIAERGGVSFWVSPGGSWFSSGVFSLNAPVQALTRVEPRMLGGVGGQGTMYSDNEGYSWHLEETDGPSQWFGFDARGKDVWAATTDGLLHSRDTGRSWESFGPSGSCYAVAVWDENTVITASESGVHAVDTRSSVSTAIWSVSAGYALHALPDGRGICAATQDSGIVFFRNPSAEPVMLRDGLPDVGFAPPTVCRIALDSHDGRLYFGNCGLPGLWSLDLSTVVSTERPSPLPELPSITHVYPHPLSAHGSVRIALHAASRIRLRLVDVLGRTRTVLHQGTLPAGFRTLPLPVASLEPGIYHLILQAAGNSDVRTIVVM